jgi:hypothetical protein
VSAKKATVFVSYASPDKPLATRLASDLRERGLTVWVDAWEIRVGDNLLEKIEAGLKEAQYIVVLLSRASVRSPWVQRELSALGKGKGDVVHLIQKLIDRKSKVE